MAPRCGERGAYYYPPTPPPAVVPPGPLAEGARPTKRGRLVVGGNVCISTPAPPPPPARPDGPPAEGARSSEHRRESLLVDAAVSPTLVDISTDEEEVPTIMLSAEEAAEFAPRFYAAYGRDPANHFRAA